MPYAPSFISFTSITFSMYGFPLLFLAAKYFIFFGVYMNYYQNHKPEHHLLQHNCYYYYYYFHVAMNAAAIIFIYDFRFKVYDLEILRTSKRIQKSFETLEIIVILIQ